MNEKDNNPKEINLIDIFVMFGKGIKNFFIWFLELLGFLLRLMYRHKVLLSFFVIISIAIGLYLSRPSVRVYKMGTMAQVYGVKSDKIKEIIRDLELSSSKFEEIGLSKKLNLPKSITKDVKRIKLYNVIDYKRDSIPDKVDFNMSHSLNDTVNVIMSNYIYLEAKVKGLEFADTIGKSIINFINSNEIVKSQFNTYTNNQKEKLNICNIELKRLDSLANKIYFEEQKKQIEFKNNELIVGNKMVQILSYEILKMQNIKNNIEKERSMAKAPIVSTNGFIIDPNPVNSYLKYSILGGLIGIAIFIFAAITLENWFTIIDYLKKKK